MFSVGAVASQVSGEVGPPAPITIDDFSGAAQGTNADPWPDLTHVLGASADYLVALVASIGAQTYQVTAGGVAMNAGPTAGPADGTNGFVRSFYLLEFELPTAGSIAIVVNPNAAAARGAVGAWSLIGAQQTALGALRSAADVHATGPTTTVSLAAVPAGAAILSGFVNNTSGTAASVAGEETENANFDGVGGTANQVFASDTVAAAGTITHTYTSPGVAGSYTAALMVEILPGAGGDPPPAGPFVTGAFYPEYASSTVAHAAVPWASLNEIYYFGCTWRTDYTASLSVATDVFTSLGHPFTNAQAVQLVNVNDSATPVHAGGSLSYDTNYFVRDVVSGVSFKLALTAGGAAINFTGAGASNGRRFKAPAAYINRYEFEPPTDAAAVTDLLAQRDAVNPDCAVYLCVGRDSSMNALITALDYGGAVGSRAGLPALIAGIRAIYDEGFDGIVTDIESMAITGVDGLGADGQFVYDLHEALRAEFPGVPIDCFFTRSGPANTMEILANTMIAEGLVDAIQVNGYALAFPGNSGQKVWHHGALHHDASDFGTPTGNTAVGQIETIAQYTGAGVPIGQIKIGLQAGGVPWTGGNMTAPAGSAGNGARFPLDDWSGVGGVAPTTPPEVTYRQFVAGSLAQTGSDIDEAAVAFYAWKNDAASANELFWSSENPTTAAAKRAYWLAQGAGGLFLWQLAGDDTAFPILSSMQ